MLAIHSRADYTFGAVDASPLTIRELRAAFPTARTLYHYYRCAKCKLFHHGPLDHGEANGWTRAHLDQQHGPDWRELPSR